MEVVDDHENLVDRDHQADCLFLDVLVLELLLNRLVLEAGSVPAEGPFERLLLLNTPMLGIRCAAAGGVLVRNLRLTGRTIALLPLFLLFRFKLPADAPSESPGE